MKKRVIDLTQKEVETICNKHDWCDRCPLYETAKCPNVDLICNKEVEVDEQNN